MVPFSLVRQISVSTTVAWAATQLHFRTALLPGSAHRYHSPCAGAPCASPHQHWPPVCLCRGISVFPPTSADVPWAENGLCGVKGGALTCPVCPSVRFLASCISISRSMLIADVPSSTQALLLSSESCEMWALGSRGLKLSRGLAPGEGLPLLSFTSRCCVGKFLNWVCMQTTYSSWLLMAIQLPGKLKSINYAGICNLKNSYAIVWLCMCID